MADGSTRREHYQAADLPPEQWGLPDLPASLAHVWEWYCDLSAARSPGMSGPCPIAWHEIQAYFCMIGECPAPHEIRAIRRLDTIAIDLARESERKHGNRDNRRRV